jgi:hypothetical protein
VAVTPDIQMESYMIDFSMSSIHSYGLPERSSKVLLEDTHLKAPYRLYSLDVFPHREWDP